MPIITISRESYSKGKEVAEKVAEKLGYEAVSREILLKASEEFNVPEIRLTRAIHDAPSILDRLSFKKEKYVAYIRAALLKHLCKDNIVYHGLAGHFFVEHISHVIKVRIISDMKDRIQSEMEQEGVSEHEASRMLKKDDEERRKWSKYLYGIDTGDPNLYDIVINVHRLTDEEAVDIICTTAGLAHFQATPESKNALNDLTLSAMITAALFDIDSNAHVKATDGSIYVKIVLSLPQQTHTETENHIKTIIKAIPGVKEIHVDTVPFLPIHES